MAESIQRILKRRALDGQHPEPSHQIIKRFGTVAQGWNQHPTPFDGEASEPHDDNEHDLNEEVIV